MVYIPVFPGTNSEYDSAKAFEKEGAKVNLVPFVTLNEEAIVKSVVTMVDNIEKANIIFLAGGFSAADEPDGAAKFIVNILLNEEFAELRDNGQIFSQYVDFEGKPSMDSKYNPNGSVNAIEGITSKNGQIIGKMGHSERFEDGLFKNIPGNKEQHLFASAVKYFTGK